MRKIVRKATVGELNVKNDKSAGYKWSKEVTVTIVLDGEADDMAWEELAIDAAIIKVQGRLRKAGKDCATEVTFRPGEELPKGFQRIDPEKAAAQCSDEQLMKILRERGLI